MIAAPDTMWGHGAFVLLLEDLGRFRAQQVLGVSTRTLNRWINGATDVPRCAVLALYWESKYGRSIIDADHYNEVTVLNALVRELRREMTGLWDRIRLMEADGQRGCANELYFEPPPLRQL